MTAKEDRLPRFVNRCSRLLPLAFHIEAAHVAPTIYDMQLNTRMGGKNLYWDDADGHIWEMLTISYARATSRSASVAPA